MSDKCRSGPASSATGIARRTPGRTPRTGECSPAHRRCTLSQQKQPGEIRRGGMRGPPRAQAGSYARRKKRRSRPAPLLSKPPHWQREADQPSPAPTHCSQDEKCSNPRDGGDAEPNGGAAAADRSQSSAPPTAAISPITPEVFSWEPLIEWDGQPACNGTALPAAQPAPALSTSGHARASRPSQRQTCAGGLELWTIVTGYHDP